MNFARPRHLPVFATAALIATGLVVSSTPASAVSGSIVYDCYLQPGPAPVVQFIAVIDTDAPDTLGTGLTVPISTTSTVTAPEVIGDGLRGANATTVSGTATATGTVDGQDRQTSITVPSTPVPPDGTPLVLVGSGPSGSITAGAIGSTILLGAGDFTTTFTGYNSSGTPVVTYSFVCIRQASQDYVVDSVSVVKVPTTTTLTVQGTPVEYGDTPVVSAEVSAAGTNAKPAGKIAFTFEGKTVTVDVKGGKAKATVAQALHLGANTVSAVFTPADPTLAESGSAKAFTVVKAGSTTATSAVYKPFKDKIVARAKVTSAHGTDVAGKVRYVLKRNGVKIRTKTVDLNRFDVAKARFRSIVRRGDYTVIARYLGSPTLKRSSDRFVVKI